MTLVPVGRIELPSSPYESDARNQLRYTDILWSLRDLNPRSSDYESAALTN